MWRIIVIVILIMTSAFFSASETALTGVNRIRLKHKAETGSSAAKKALKLVEKYDKMLATILIGNNSANLFAASLATVFAIALAATFGVSEGMMVTVVTAAITVILIIAGEFLPKALAREHAESYILATAGILTFIMVVLTPVSYVILLIQNVIARGLRGDEKQVSVTEEELIHIINEIEDEGVLDEQESDLVRSALEFDETTVEEVLTPRVDMTAVALTDSVEKVRDVFFESGYSRLPVYDQTPDKVVGVISNKVFMKQLLSENPIAAVQPQEIVRIPSLMKLSDALKLMQKKKSHLAVVLDQYGGTEGIITMEDILEELVGEIWDEDDEAKEPVTFTGESSFEVAGELSVNDFNRAFEVYSKIENIEIDSESNTVGGWVFELFGKIPDKGETVETGDFKITVLSMDEKRIGKLRFEILEKPAKLG